MANRLGSMTAEALQAQTDLPDEMKAAIEHAIWECTAEGDDLSWADHFRAAVVETERECEKLEHYDKDIYGTESVWFKDGWDRALGIPFK